MKYPDDWTGFNHASSQIFSGALWDLRKFFGQEEMDTRIMRTLKQEPENMVEFIEKFLIIDDDNYNLDDGTPHITEVCQAFYRNHGLFCDDCAFSLGGIPVAIINSPPHANFDAVWEGEGQNMFITGPITIKGTVLGSASTINPFCKIEYADVRHPDQWLTEGIDLNPDIDIDTVTNYSGTVHPVIDQILATWDISNIPNGIYTIRLTVSDEEGSEAVTSITQVGVTPRMHEGWPKFLNADVANSPGYGNLDSADPDLEIAVCSESAYGMLYTINADGSGYWTNDLGSGAQSSPAIGDIDLDGELDVVIGTTANHMIYAYGGDGSLKWSHNLGDRTFSTPALGNVNTEDDELEIVIGADNGMVYVYGHDGEVEGAYPVIGKVRSSPALGDIDNDNLLEIVVCSGEDVVENGIPTEDQHIYVLEHDGTQKWHTVTGDPTGKSSPVLADIDLDNELEIVVSNAKQTYVFEAEGGQPLASEEYLTWGATSFPVVGNIDSDPQLEVVVSTETGVRAFNHDMSAIEGWDPLNIEGVDFSDNAVLLVNLDADSQLEIIVQSRDPSELYAFNLDGSIVEGWPKIVYHNINQSHSIDTYPAIGDIDNDGYLEIIACYSSGAAIYVYDLDVPANDDFYDHAWPMFRYNAARTGLYE